MVACLSDENLGQIDTFGDYFVKFRSELMKKYICPNKFDWPNKAVLH